MSRSRHRQHSRSAVQWNPPPVTGEGGAPHALGQSVVSATECTGIEPRRPQDSEHKPADSK